MDLATRKPLATSAGALSGHQIAMKEESGNGPATWDRKGEN